MEPEAPVEDDRPAGSPVWAFLRLGAVMAVVAALFVLAGMGALLIVIVALIIMVMLHELGHFATAKWSKMKVTEFFVGFGPRLWSVRRGETEYGFKAIPAGGYVKIPGMSNLEEIDPEDEAGTYRQKPIRNRILVASAGSIVHLLIALVLAYVAVLAFGAPTRVQIAGFSVWPSHRATAAQAAGLRPGDVVTAVNGHQMSTPTAFLTTVEHSAGKPVHLTVERDGHTKNLTVTPVLGHVNGTTETLGAAGSGTAIGLIGVHDTLAFSPEGPVRGAGTAAADLGHTIDTYVRVVPQSFTNLYHDIVNPSSNHTQAGSERTMSIIGIGRTATQAEQSGIYTLLWFFILINIAFAIINMLPMLPLDGGHVAIAVYERIRTPRGKPYYQADAAKLMPVAYAFMALLMVVVVASAYLDIAHPVANPFR